VEHLAKVSTGGRVPLLGLHDSIRHDDPSMQPLLSTVDNARARTALLLAAWQVARVLAGHLGETVLAERARPATAWPPCPLGGTALRRKGLVKRQVTRLLGPRQGRRRGGRWPQGWASPPVAPLDEALGGPPPQRTSGALPALGGALALLVPLATAARLLGWDSGAAVSSRAVWRGVQAAGPQAMAHRQEDWESVARGPVPLPEPLAAALAVWPWALGAQGVLVPFRPEAGKPRGKLRWRASKGGVLARLGQHHPRPGPGGTRLAPRRLGAVLGAIEALTPRLGLEALRQGLRQAPQVVWLSDGGRGVWRLFDGPCSASATGRVALYHAVPHRWKRAAAWRDGRRTPARRWCGWARPRLRHGKPAGGRADVAAALEGEGWPPTARAPVPTV
jgi:hypothetical protein